MGYISVRVTYALLIITIIVSPLFLYKKVFSAQLLNRSVAIGSSVPSAVTNHLFRFDLITVGNIGSIQFEYCSNSPLNTSPCTPPAGLDVSSAIISSQTGEVGFSMDPGTTVNSILISRPSSLNSAVSVSYNFSNIVNSSSPFDTNYVRISSYATSDGSGPKTDEGSVAFAIDTNVTVSGFVPPYLTFCVGVTVAGDCSSASGEFLSFGELITSQPRYLTSQFAGATNDPGGYSTFVAGLTMTSGTNVIPALNSPQPSVPGVSQFGMNLRSNSNPGVGSNPSGVGSSIPVVDFNQVNLFKFGNQVVTSSSNSTDFNLFTVSYIVNIADSQPAGIYNTTLTYIATAAF
jgi:hypothetical protein